MSRPLKFQRSRAPASAAEREPACPMATSGGISARSLLAGEIFFASATSAMPGCLKFAIHERADMISGKFTL